ncbi:MAG: TonB family protein [Janthinobacterium lividum]
MHRISFRFSSFLGGLLLAAGVGQARPVGPSDTLVTYLDHAHAALPSAVGAAYRVKTVPTDSVAGVEYTYTLDGWLVSRTDYAHLRQRQQQGLHEEYYPLSRQRKVVSHFQQNTLNGELLSYYPSGQLKRREQYRANVSQGGECYGLLGQPISFVPYLIMAEFPGGLAGLERYIRSSVAYPQAARKLGYQCRVLVDFVLDARGAVQQAHPRAPGFAALDAEARRVVEAMPRWQPALVEGTAAAMHFALPITFKL